ncbi:MAG: endolytic transglycosylase MltG [Clostridiales bacterium]|nr:endolytic transglycosylase MltG [Clostridiales bacterium]
MADEHRASVRSQSQREPSQPQPRKKRPRRRRSAAARVAGAFLYVLLVIGLSGVLATLGWTWACDLLGLNKTYASTVITIEEDTDFNAIVDQLEEEGLIQYKFLFKLYTQFSHAKDKIAPGTYELNTEMDYHALVSSMGSSSATRQTTDITLKEGLTIDQVFDLLADRGVTSVEKLQDMAANYDYAFDWLQDRPLGDYHRLEGYLFPDTYTFELGENPKYVINKMLVNFDSKMDEYMAQYSGEEAQYSLHDIVTIASMIEKETDGTNTAERNDYRSIASVIYNRLENPAAETAGYLQIDATLVYLNGGKVPTEADKSINSPYNTYLYQGLPAGPISNPGMQSLLAAMNPADTGYYYYVLNPETKQHEYSRTFADHNVLVQRYGSDG